MSKQKIKQDGQEPNAPSKEANALLEVDEPENETDELSRYDDSAYIWRAFTFSKMLSESKAKKLIQDLNRSFKHPDTDLERLKPIKENKQIAYDQKGDILELHVQGCKYDTSSPFDLPTWTIKKNSWTKGSSEFTTYQIDATIYLGDYVYNKDTDDFIALLERLIKEYAGVSKEISPILGCLSTYEVVSARYEILDISFDESLPYSLVKKLIKRSNISSSFLEWESCCDENAESRAIIRENRSVCFGRWTNRHSNSTIFYMYRTYKEKYSVKNLLENNSAGTKLILESMFSLDYARKIVANYLQVVFMGGQYYSIVKAARIINESGIDTSRQQRLVSSLYLIEKERGITNAKMLKSKDEDSKALLDFVCDLHRLVELGINPVPIPEEFEIDELSNPFLSSHNKIVEHIDNDIKSASKLIEVDELLGFSTINSKSWS